MMFLICLFVVFNLIKQNKQMPDAALADAPPRRGERGRRDAGRREVGVVVGGSPLEIRA